jgi:hypothetical protein
MTTTTVTFTGIKKKIQEQIEKSKNSIKISLACQLPLIMFTTFPDNPSKIP